MLKASSLRIGVYSYHHLTVQKLLNFKKKFETSRNVLEFPKEHELLVCVVLVKLRIFTIFFEKIKVRNDVSERLCASHLS